MAKGKSKGGKRKGGKRKLHGAALKAHNARMRREGHHYGKGKRKGSKRGKRDASGVEKKLRALDSRVGSLEAFRTKQKKLNSVFAHSINHIYAGTGLSRPGSIRRIGNGQ